MKKWILIAAVIVVIAAFAIYQHDHNTNSSPVLSSTAITTPATTPVDNPTATDTSTSTATATAPVTTAPTATTSTTATTSPATTPVVTATSGEYKDGTYTGSVANAFYGNVQVAAVISGGKLTDVQLLQAPNDNGHSAQVTRSATPQLKTEAIASQSANVNVISGATQTSQAFIQSLASALSQAKA